MSSNKNSRLTLVISNGIHHFDLTQTTVAIWTVVCKSSTTIHTNVMVMGLSLVLPCRCLSYSLLNRSIGLCRQNLCVPATFPRCNKKWLLIPAYHLQISSPLAIDHCYGKPLHFLPFYRFDNSVRLSFRLLALINQGTLTE